MVVKVGPWSLLLPRNDADDGRNACARSAFARWPGCRSPTARPQDALKAIVAAQTLGYEATVLFYLGGAHGDRGSDAPVGARRWTTSSFRASGSTWRLPHLRTCPIRASLDVLAPLCQAGWMPLAFAAWGNDPRQVIQPGHLPDFGRAQPDLGQDAGSLSGVLSPLSRLAGPAFLPEELIPWIEELTRHGLDFFSVYHVANTEKALWPLLQSINIRCQEESAQPATPEPAFAGMPDIPQPVYITGATSDTVWGIITRHGLTKQQFWAWNAHLWESRGLPRDPDYLQEGWRIRVK
jgi:hypothetical protein